MNLRQQIGLVSLLHRIFGARGAPAQTAVLELTSAEARTLTAEDAHAMRELGATDAMLVDLQRRAQVPGLVFTMDFADLTVSWSRQRCDKCEGRLVTPATGD